MVIASDWDFNYSAQVISHIDGVLTYDGGSGTQPAVGEYIIAGTSGAVGKILAETGDEIAGTLTLTNVIGRFVDGEELDQLSTLDFDGVDNGGFQVGDTIVDQVTGSMVVKFIEYNIDGTPGHGTVYGNAFAAFTNNSQIDISGGTADVAEADGVGTDNDSAWDADPDGSLAVPGTADTNDSVVINYDAGTITIPEDAHIADTTGLTGAEGYAQKVIGAIATGSIRVVDSDTTGAGWLDDNTLYVHDVVYYDALVAGKVFSEGDVIKAVVGASPDAVGRVLYVIDDGDDTGQLMLAGMSGTWDNDNEIHVKQADDSYVKYAEVEDAQNDYLAVALVNIPAALGGVRDEQREDQGGIYAAGSLNIVRSANAVYSYAQDLYDELSQLDDLPAFEGNVKDQLYTVLNDYIIPDLSFRFIEKGSFKDSGNNNIFVNIQTTGALADIGDHGYFYNSSNPTPQPDMYVEQDNAVIRQDWLEGNLDIILKVKTSTDPAYINPAVEALGQLINSGDFTTHIRPYFRTFDSNEVNSAGGGIAIVALGNAADLNNTTGQYDAAFGSGVGTPFTVGEEITTTDGKRGIISTSDSGASGNITYALKSAANFVNTDNITGSVSEATAQLANPTNVVAGYGTDIKVMTVNSIFTGGTTAVAVYVIGEQVNQAGGGAYIGYILEDDSGDLYTEDVSGTRANGEVITGQTSGATNTPSGNAAQTDVPKDIGGGVGDKDYTAVTSADITGADPKYVLNVYEWWKFLLRKESTLIQGGPGSASGVEGRIFRRLVDTFAEVRGASPYGQKAGALVITCQGHFIDKDTLHSDDLRNIQNIDNLGDTYDPPNLQILKMSNLIISVSAAIYRTAAPSSETIQRTEFKVGAVGTHNQAGDNTILVAAQDRAISPLPNDVPDSAVLRILDPLNSGDYLRFPYASVDRATNVFTLASGTIGDVTGAEDLVENDNAHVVLVEETASGTSVQNTIQYVTASDIYVYAVARIKGKQPFKTTGTFGSTGLNIGAVLNPDNVVDLP